MMQLYFKLIKLFRINKVLASVILVAFTTLVYFAAKKFLRFVRPPIVQIREVV